MSVGTTTALLIGGGLAAAGGVASSVVGSNAAGTAASQQEQADQSAITEQQREFNVAQQNSAPFVQAGQQSIGNVMSDLQSGKFNPGMFSAPSLADVQNTPGFQFTAQQGSKGILEGASAAGGAISGGTLKALDSYNTNLANTTYNDAFNRALATYGTNLSAQQQQFSQELAPAQIGAGSTASINSTGASSAASIGQIMQSLGASQAAGTVGSSNAITSGLTGGLNGITSSLLLGKLLGGGDGSSGPGLTTSGPNNPYGPNYSPAYNTVGAPPG